MVHVTVRTIHLGFCTRTCTCSLETVHLCAAFAHVLLEISAKALFYKRVIILVYDRFLSCFRIKIINSLHSHTGGAYATENDILTEFARNSESYNCILAAVVFVDVAASSSSPPQHVTYKLRMAPLNSFDVSDLGFVVYMTSTSR